MSVERWIVKFAAGDPESFHSEAFVPVFHHWIQKHRLPLMLIDVADYAHVPDGPGVLLVSHEYQIFIDRFDGRPGLTVQRKLRGGAGTASLVETLRAALQVVQAVEREPSLPGAKFRLDEVEVVANDRLHGPNTDDGWAAVEPSLREAGRSLYGEAATVARVAVDCGRRLTARIAGDASDDSGVLLGRLG